MRRMRHYGLAATGRPALLLAHGAGAGESHPWMQAVAEGLTRRGIPVVTFDFPYMQARRKIPDPAPVLERAFQDAFEEAVGSGPGGICWFVGGKSMGGRIATQALARDMLAPRPSGVVCFGYPLHPPGKPAVRRDGHLTHVAVPILLLHGTRDPFGSPAEMSALVEALPGSTLHLVDDGDHSLQQRGAARSSPVALDAVLDRAAAWMHEHC